MIIIESKKDGFRRCDLAHPSVATSYSDDRFTAEELAALQAEPLLIVRVVEEADENEAPSKSKGKTKSKPDADKPDADKPDADKE